MSIAIVWFRRDLRLTDHPALQAALSAGHQVVPVYIHSPDEEKPWQPGAPVAGGSIAAFRPCRPTCSNGGPV